MKQILGFLIVISTLFLFTGCGPQVEPPLYTWNDYTSSSSEYGMKGEQKEVLEKHLSVLEKIITDSENEKKRVAPGIYAEYAQILFETNQKEKAKKYFLLEKQIYPESTIFMDRVLKKLYGEIL